MNPNFKILESKDKLHWTEYTVEVSNMTIDWLLDNFSKDLKSSGHFLCCFIANSIEGSRRRGDTELTHHLTDNFISVSNHGAVSSAKMNYSLMMGLGLSKKAMAGVRAVMRANLSVFFEKGCNSPINGTESFSITALIYKLRFRGSKNASAAIADVYNDMMRFQWSDFREAAYREFILKKIKEKNPNFIFPTLTFTYTARNES